MTSNSASRSDVSAGGAGTEELQKNFSCFTQICTDSWICDLKIANTGYYHNILKISL